MHLCMWECVCVFAYEKVLLALQLSVQRAVHLYFTTHLTDMPNVRQVGIAKYLYLVSLLHITVGGFLSVLIAAILCIKMNNQFI